MCATGFAIAIALLPPSSQLPSPLAAMLGFVKANLEYLALASKHGSNPEALAATCLATVLKKIGEVRSVTLTEATNILEVVQASVLDDAAKKGVSDLISSRALPGDVGFTAKLQTMEAMEQYLTESDWASLENAVNVTSHEALCTLASRCLAIGLIHPSEVTAKKIVSLYLCKRCAESGVEALELLRTFKKLLKSSVVAEFHKVGPSTYPHTTVAFKDRYPALFAEAYPEPSLPTDSRVSRVALLRLQYGMPCRNTKTTCSGAPSQRGLAVPPTSTVICPIQAMAHKMANAFMERLPAPSGPPERLALMDKEVVKEIEKKADAAANHVPTLSPVPAGGKSPWPAFPPSWTGESGVSHKAVEQAVVPDTACPGDSITNTSKIVPTAIDVPAAQGKLASKPAASTDHMIEAMKDHLKKSTKATPSSTPSTGSGAEDAAKGGCLKRPAAAVVSDTSSIKKRPGAHALPVGWTQETRVRATGAMAGQKCVLYFDRTGKQFRSMCEVVAAM
jgi:hypothetical protein